MFGMDTIVILAVLLAFYSAMNIGGNDVANAMGTSVASKALTYWQAIIVAAVFEFCGALFVGAHVTETVRSGMLDMKYFENDPRAVMYGMTAALAGTAIWLRFATFFGWPVSTTHSIVGAVVGFGIVARGFEVVKWTKISSIVASWLISPIAGGIMAFFIFTFIRSVLLESKDPVKRTKKVAPLIVFTAVFVIALSLLYKGLKNLNLDLPFGTAVFYSALAGVGAMILSTVWIKYKFKGNDEGNDPVNYARVEGMFKILQIMTACYVAFAHGANDVANAIGPLAAVLSIANTGEVGMKVPIPIWVLGMGGVGIVIGFLVLGRKVMETIGSKITEIVPSRGFSAEFATATTVLICSKLGLPVSTTHTIVGSVIGVGMARGIGALNLGVIREIIASWFITLPATIILTIVVYMGISFAFGT